MKKIIILISIIFLASCAHKYNVEKANTYLMSHKDRPAHIKEALLAGNVVQGMNEEEVHICVGKPDIITTTQSFPSNEEVTFWGYLAPSKRVFIFFCHCSSFLLRPASIWFAIIFVPCIVFAFGRVSFALMAIELSCCADRILARSFSEVVSFAPSFASSFIIISTISGLP